MEHAELKAFLSFQFDDNQFYDQLNQVVSTAPSIFTLAAAAFKDNLQSVLSTIFLPATLASVTQRAFAERIPQLTPDNLLDEIAVPEIVEPVNELLRQGTVLTWTALEVLANDLFMELLNFVPDLTETLMQNENFKRRFQLKNITFETLHEFGYNLSSKMGRVITARQSLDNTAIIKDVFDALAGDNNNALSLLLGQDRLWLLNQRRNLIVHRMAVIDELYTRSTEDTAKKGSKLAIKVSDIQTDLHLVRDIGMEMLKVVSRRLRIVPI